MRLFLGVCIILMTKIAFSQISNVQGGSNELIREKKYEDIEGSPYLFKTWLSGTLTDKQGKTITDLLIKYDAYKEKLEVNQNGTALEISTSLYDKFTINEVDENSIRKHVFTIERSFPGFKNDCILEVMVNGRNQLLKKHQIHFIEENVTSYGSSIVKKRFQINSRYFIKEGEKIVEVKPSKFSILEKFPQHKDYLKIHKVKNEVGLIDFAIFLNRE